MERLNEHSGHLVRFLLVEDDENHAELVRRGLEKAKVANTFDWVKTGEEAIEYLSKTDKFADMDTPDVVLLDIRLPGKDGFEVLTEIREELGMFEIPVVILTTSTAEVDRIKAYKHKANSYLVKPLDFDAFKAMIDSFSFYWGAWNTPAYDPN